MKQERRDLLKGLGAGAALLSIGGCAAPVAMAPRARPRVVVIGAGYGGATAARYLRMWGDGTVDVDLVERAPRFVSCPLSNLVIGGNRRIEDISIGYDTLASRHGVRLVRDEAVAIDLERRQVRLAGGNRLDYDRLVISPGIDFMFDTIPGLSTDAAQSAIPHAWKAGPQTLLLRAQLESMRDGGVFAIHIPKAPYRCPPGPYERVCQVADYLKRSKPRSKILVLDSNPDIVSKKGLFTKAWTEMYPGMVEYRPNSELMDVDVATRTAKLTFNDVSADVLNVIPPQKAAAIAAPFITANNRWCETDWLTCASRVNPNVHIIGDATLSASQMPKSGHMANQHGHLVADAVLALLAGRTPTSQTLINNTCYSYVSGAQVVHVASVHRYDAAKQTYLPVEGAGGLSAAANEAEAAFADAWARNIWSDMLG